MYACNKQAPMQARVVRAGGVAVEVAGDDDRVVRPVLGDERGDRIGRCRGYCLALR